MYTYIPFIFFVIGEIVQKYFSITCHTQLRLGFLIHGQFFRSFQSILQLLKLLEAHFIRV